MRRWLVRLGLGAIVLVVVLVVAAKLVLRTGFAANKVAAQLQDAAGAPVHVGSLDVGITSSALHDLQFQEDGASEGSPPWAIIPTVEADLSLPQLLRGDLAGGTITLRGPKLIIRLDRDNHVLTKFPSPEGGGKAWPEFRIVAGQVTFQREGVPDALFNNINGTLRKDGDHIKLDASADDPEWGKWTVAGERPSADSPFKLNLHTDVVRLTPDKLRRVPFVPLVTWEQVSLDGETPVDLAVQFGGGSTSGSTVHYRVVLAPRKTTVQVPSIDLTTGDTAGKAVIEDGVVTLTDIRGHAAGGALHLVRSVMDFRGDVSEMGFNVTAERLQLKDLPAKWGMLGFDGRLSGRADLALHIRDGKVRTSGGGEGVIEGFLSQQVKVKMLADEHGFRFDVTNAPGAAAPRPVPGRLGGADGTAALQSHTRLLAPEGRPSVARGETPGTLTDSAEPWKGDSDCRPSRASFLSGRVPGVSPLATDGRPSGVNDRVTLAVVDTLLARLLATGLVAIQPAQPAGGQGSGQTIRLNLGLQDVNLAELVQKLNLKLPIRLDGKVTFHVQATIPLSDAKDLKLYHATGNVELPWVRIDDLWLQQVKARVVLENGVLRLEQLAAHVPTEPPAAPPTALLPGGDVGGSGELTLTGQYPFAVHLDLPPWDLGAIHALATAGRLGGSARLTADGRGSLSPFTVRANGSAHVDGFAINAFRIGTLDFRWEADPERVRLSEFAARLYGGQLAGTATIPLKPTVGGRIELTLDKLDTTNLTKDVPQTPVRLEGSAEGSVVIDIPAAAADGQRAITADVNLQAEHLRVQNIPADRLKATVGYRNGAAEYKIEGQTLGGTFDLSGRYPDRPAQPPKEQGRIRVHGIELARLADALRVAALRPLAGRLDLDASFDHVGADPNGSGRLVLTRLGWGGHSVTDQLTGVVRVMNGTLSVEDVSGQVAGGSVRARFTYDYRHPERSAARIIAQRVDARTLLAPFADPPPLDGPLDVRLHARFWREWTGSGQVMMGNGKLFGVSVRDARFPIAWTIAPGHRGELRLTDAGAQASRGRLSAQANLTWGDAARLDGQARFTAVDLGELLSHYTESRVVGGLATGRVEFGGRNMRSGKDLTARVEAKLAQAVPSQMPVFRQVMPFILPGVGTNVQFQSGDLRGVLGGGVFRIEQLTLVGDLARMYAEGTVTLQQRLNLDVVANTNQLGMDPAALQIFGVTLPAVGPIPLGVLNQATAYMSNRTIRLKVTGTIKAPSIRVNPVALLSESAVRFFMSQTGIPLPTAAMQAPGP